MYACKNRIRNINVQTFFNEFSSISPVRLIPFFEEKIDETVLSWSYFKSISTRLTFPTYEDMEEFASSGEGEKLGFITYLSGLKVDINISGSNKLMLSEYPVKDFISSMVGNDYCDKLLIKGGDFATEEIRQIDIKNAVVKYSEKVLTISEYIEDDMAKDILLNSINDTLEKVYLNQYDDVVEKFGYDVLNLLKKIEETVDAEIDYDSLKKTPITLNYITIKKGWIFWDTDPIHGSVSIPAGKIVHLSEKGVLKHPVINMKVPVFFNKDDVTVYCESDQSLPCVSENIGRD